MAPETVEATLDQCQRDIDHLKLHGMSVVILCKILEMMVNVLRTLALHTAKARIR
jgi:hypothetical protein